MEPEDGQQGLCERLAWLRQAAKGPRGRAEFARAIGVSPSTYHYYEKGRRPPVDLLVRAAALTGASLEWLLTGEGAPFPATPAEAPDTELSPEARDALARLARGGETGPAADAARAALASLLRRMERTFPAAKSPWLPRAFRVGPTSVPILGRTAAGVPAAWDRYFAGEEDPDVLEGLLARLEGGAARGREAEVAAADPQQESAGPADALAMIIQLSAPTPDGVVEYVDLPGLGPQPPGTFALRVDGDSMIPRIRDGDIVVSRRGAAPQPGRTAIVRVRGRVGVTVKLWRPEGETVHLVPINEARDPSVLALRDILWACRVLWVVRL